MVKHQFVQSHIIYPIIYLVLCTYHIVRTNKCYYKSTTDPSMRGVLIIEKLDSGLFCSCSHAVRKSITSQCSYCMATSSGVRSLRSRASRPARLATSHLTLSRWPLCWEMRGVVMCSCEFCCYDDKLNLFNCCGLNLLVLMQYKVFFNWFNCGDSSA